MARAKPLPQEPGSGNVFADLGLPDPGEHLLKAGLVLKIAAIIEERGLSQTTAAHLLGIDQPKVSALLGGRFRGYSVERLLRFLVALGPDVGMREIAISKFMATCLAVLDEVGRTGNPVRITRFGKPVAEVRPPMAAAPRKWLGAMEGSAELTADITGPRGAFGG